MNPISAIIVGVFGGIIVISVMVVFIFPMLSDLPIFVDVHDSIVSSGEGLNSMIPVFAVMLGVGVIGAILQKR